MWFISYLDYVLLLQVRYELLVQACRYWTSQCADIQPTIGPVIRYNNVTNTSNLITIYT